MTAARRRISPTYQKYLNTKSAVFKGLCVAFTVLILAILAFVTAYLLSKGFTHISLSFFTKLPIPPGMEDAPGGMKNALIGTIILIALASAVGIPLGILAGVYLSEYSSNSYLGAPVRFISDVLSGVPSIVVGILGYELLVVPIAGWNGTIRLNFEKLLSNPLLPIIVLALFSALVVLFTQRMKSNLVRRIVIRSIVQLIVLVPVCVGLYFFTLRFDHADHIKILPNGNFNGYAGAAALAFIMIPLVARTTEEMLRLVPRSYREASIALGATKARTILKVVIPAATGSLITGVMLAIARIAGETAPLLFTAMGSRFLTLDPSKQFPSLTVQVFNYATGPYKDEQQLAWAGMLILIGLVFVLNLLVRLTIHSMQRNKLARA